MHIDKNVKKHIDYVVKVFKRNGLQPMMYLKEEAVTPEVLEYCHKKGVQVIPVNYAKDIFIKEN